MARITIGRVLSSATDSVTAQQGGAPWTVQEVRGLVVGPYDRVAPAYDGAGNMTSARYYLGATLVRTLTMTYDGSGNMTNAVAT